MAFITLHPPGRATSQTLGAERTPICADMRGFRMYALSPGIC